MDSAGNLYIAGAHRIRKIDSTGTITTVAGTGKYGFSGDGGPAVLAQLMNPRGVAVDSAGNLYIADTGNHSIRKVDSTGTITTFVGTEEYGFGGDGGPATQARLNDPFSVAVDSAGSLYIADTGNHRIRKVDSTGTITTFVGGVFFGGDGGPATQARLAAPSGAAVDSAGNLYIVDSSNHDKLEVQVGSGYVWGGGAENPGPSLPTYDVGIALWLNEHWGGRRASRASPRRRHVGLSG